MQTIDTAGLSELSSEVLVLAEANSKKDGSYCGCDQLLLALLKVWKEYGIFDRRLKKQVRVVQDELAKAIRKDSAKTPPTKVGEVSPRFKKVMSLSAVKARQEESESEVCTRHILHALLREGDGLATDILKRGGVGLDLWINIQFV